MPLGQSEVGQSATVGLGDLGGRVARLADAGVGARHLPGAIPPSHGLGGLRDALASLDGAGHQTVRLGRVGAAALTERARIVETPIPGRAVADVPVGRHRIR